MYVIIDSRWVRIFDLKMWFIKMEEQVVWLQDV